MYSVCHSVRSFLLLYILFFIAGSLSCNSGNHVAKYTIGFSQCTMVNQWRQTMLGEMKRELSFHPEIGFIFKDANGNTDVQIRQIEQLIDQNVDLLIVSPNEAAPITSVVEKAFDKGIKVIIVDRRTLSQNYTAYVGASNYEVGIDAGTFANSILKGKGNILEVSDIPGSSADIDRHKGFTDFIKEYPGIKYTAKVYEEGDEHPSGEKVTQFLKSDPDIQLIFAQNDRLAFSAYKVCKKLGLDQTIKIIGVDGLAGKNAGIDLVERGSLKATILYPTGGEEAILIAANVIENKPFKKENELMASIIDSSNVRIMRLQNDKVLEQQKNIDRSQQNIEVQKIITRNKINIIYAISISLALALILGLILLYSLRENKKINAKLALQNEEILNQRNQLIELGKQAKEATDAKINFFTNISHEFRTPLTLILGPLEELLANSRLHFADKQYLTLIQKNVIRLLRLVNQLIDFRKIESDKMKISATENDLVLFTNEITDAFKEMAKKRNIDLRVISKERSIFLWFDSSMLDKVLFNLLSNAFKFTNDNGFILITLEKNTTEHLAVITVEDNGIGMSKDVAEHAFELFYQGNITNQQGSGLGLSLSKELISLHGGSISVNSKPGKGTCFEIKLPLGIKHLEKDEMLKEKSTEEVMYFDQKIYSTEFNTVAPISENNIGITDMPELSILIIEDNPDLRNFLAEILHGEYAMILAEDGIIGLRKAFDNIPDIIILDVVLPKKDGFFITNTLKNDIKTSHIPIILLTAKADINQQIEGMKSMADAYVTKPFNVQFLKETIRSVIKNREILRDHYTSEIKTDAISQNPKKLDRKFINEFMSIVEINLSNENFNVDHLCKQMAISKIQLYRKVKALLDCNVNDYILDVRVQKSKYLLNQGEFTVSEIAYKVGFSSPAYFSTVFKTKVGKTPTEFKNKK
jgi:signal transduction histidine kinase/DNA-binding response OmpR family regulator